MDTKIIDKVLNNTASEEEARMVAAWFSTEEGKKYLAMRFDREAFFMDEQILAEWSEDKTIPSNHMRMRFLSEIKRKIFPYKVKLVAAALIPFFILLSAFTYLSYKTKLFETVEYASVYAPYGEQIQLILQDGTHVQLNAGTTLKYPKTFGLFSREVFLDGEAYFKVAHENGRPFMLKMDGMDLKVTGTQFNAKAYLDENIISISLEEGSVSLFDKSKNPYHMQEGQNAEYNKTSGVCTLTSPNDMSVYTAWKSKSLNFYRTPLGEILKVLERQYDVTFSTDSLLLLDYRFSMSSSKVQISDILQDLEKVSRIIFEKTAPGKFRIISYENN